MCKTGVIGVVDVRIIKQQFGIISTGLRSSPLNLSWARGGGGCVRQQEVPYNLCQ